jgi:hypothetical protein
MKPWLVGPALAAGPSRTECEIAVALRQTRRAGVAIECDFDCRCGLPTSGSPTMGIVINTWR